MKLVNWRVGELVNGLAARRRSRIDRRLEVSSNHRVINSAIRQLDRGFTMIELLVVVSLIVILATMGLTQYRASVIHAREATLKEDLEWIREKTK